MKPYRIDRNDVLEALKGLEDNSFDGLFCDPPYGFRFMGKKWDYDVPSTEVWREALRVLKPGAALLAFGGARTFHRIAVNLEDAGFELRDCLCWLYGEGFPKSQNIGLAIDKAAGATRPVLGPNPHARPGDGRTENLATAGTTTHHANLTGPATDLAKQWDGYGTALKPGWEPCLLARKPLDGTMVENVTRWGCGGLAIDACRIVRAAGDVTVWGGRGSGANLAMSGANYGGPKNEVFDGGRWPSNLILDEDAGALLDESTGEVQSGGPSRFFYCAKVATKEREYGCENLPLRSAGEVTDREDGSDGLASPRAGAGRTGGARNHHPTLKPIALTRWLATLIKPPRQDARLLVPYSGAGSEMIGALLAGWGYVLGVEGDKDYIAIARARIPAHVDR